VRYIFNFKDQVMLSIFKLGGYEGNIPELTTWLAREGEPEFVLCEDEKLARFLNGFIIKNRGSKGDNIPKPERVLTNNMVLWKLKIALNLQADDLLKMLRLNKFTLSRHELSALFRRPNHKNYRECLDQLLRNVLSGMEKHYRKNLQLPKNTQPLSSASNETSNASIYYQQRH
jgi:uncharacterized protein YehS (DUF1456 family)